MSYLGKISALVTVNTGDFAPKLNAAAKEVRSFAKQVESNIGSSMRAATKALDDIYTPLQKFERSMRAAASMKLSFSGFPGAIKSIDDLKQRLTSLNNRQIGVILKTSGLKDIESFRQVLTGLRSREFDLLVKVGGIEKLNELRQSMLSGDGRIEVVAETKAAVDRLAELRARLEDIKAGRVPVRVAVEGLDEAKAGLESAKKAMTDFVVAASGGTRVKASTYLDELNSQLAEGEDAIQRMRAMQAERERLLAGATTQKARSRINSNIPDQSGEIAQKQQEVADLKQATSELQNLVDQYAAAKKRLNSAKSIAGDGGLKQTEKEIRAAERALKDLMQQSLVKVSAKLGFQLDMKSLESLLSGGAINQAGRLGEKLREMGVSAADATKLVAGVMDALGSSDQSAGIARLQRLQSAAEAIGKPVQAMKDKLVSAGQAIEGEFGGAMSAIQAKVENLRLAINKLESDGDNTASVDALTAAFKELERDVEVGTAAINRFVEARGKLDQIKTGRELAFAAPELNAALGRSASIGSAAASLPATAIQASPQIAESLIQIRKLSDDATAAFARLEAAKADGFQLSIDSASTNLNYILKLLGDVQAKAEQEIKVQADAGGAAKKSVDNELGFLIRREQAAKRLEDERAAIAQKAAENEIALVIRREQAAKRLEDERAAAAQKAAENEIGFLVRREQAAKRLEDERAAIAQKAAENEIGLLIRREQAAKRLEDERAAAAMKAAESEIGWLIRREQAAKRLEDERAAVAQKAAENEIGWLIRREQAAKRLEDERAAVVQKAAENEIGWLVRREQAAKRLEDERAAAAQKAAENEIGWLVRREQEAKRLEDERAAIEQRVTDNEIARLIRREQAAKRLEDERTADDATGRSTPLGPGYLMEGFQRQTRNILGPALDDPLRQIGRFGSSITSIKGQLDALPLPIRQHFVPAIVAAEQEFARLRLLGTMATAEDIENATNNMRTLEAAAQRATRSFAFQSGLGGRNAQDFELNLQGRSLQGYQAQLQILQNTLGRVSAEARGIAAPSFLALQNAISTAFQEGTLDAMGTRTEIERLTREAVEATASVARINVRGLQRQVQRAGDVGRAGLDRWSLALNQAAFAVDDFMSSTGGIEFKLRAISNNITQLAFILGGTAGLFVGLGAVIAGQAAVGLMKWINNGRTAEDQTKALSDALARQKSLAEDLAQAWESLGDAISRGLFSDAASKAADFDRELSSVIKKQKELRESNAAALDPDVQRERAEQNKLRRQLEDEKSPGARVAIQRELNESARREREATERAATRTTSGGEISAAIERSVRRVETAALPTVRGVPLPADAARVEAAARAAGAAVPQGNTADAIKEQRRLLRERIERLSPIAAQSGGGRVAQFAATELENLQRLLNSLEIPLQKAFDELSNQIIRSSRGAALGIEQAQGDVADAIRRGVRGAADFQAAIDATARQLRDAEQQLAEAQKIENDPDRRELEINRAKDRINDVRNRQEAIAERGREVRLGRTFGGERTTTVLSQLQGNERFANEYSGIIARLTVSADAEMEARRNLEKAIASGSDEEQAAARSALEAAQAQSDLAAAAAEAAKALEDAVARIRKIGAEAISESERLADDAQRRFNENPTAENRAERDRVEMQLIDDRERLARANNALDRRRSEIAASNPAIAMIDDQIADIRDRREQLAEDARVSETEADPAEMERLRNEEARLLAERERAMHGLTEAERRQQEAIAQEIAARRRLIEEAERQRQAEIERGRQRNEEAFGVGGARAGIERGMEAAQRLADEAQAAFAENPTEENRKRRDEAEGRVRETRARRQELQDELDAAERRFNSRTDIAGKREDIERRERERADIIATAKRENRELTGVEVARIDAIDEANREDRASVDRERDKATRGERDAIDRFEQDQSLIARADRGRRLGMTDRERFREDMETGVAADIRARAAQIKKEGGDFMGFMDKALSEQIKDVAPMLEEFRMERETAMLQGPSRAALQVSDVTTTQGQSELNRLLRGDDAAKDVNLAELKNQTGKLQELIDAVKNNPLPVIP